ncbi:MAG: helix-turn-helix domain-containing protein [Bacteroidia bacterium]
MKKVFLTELTAEEIGELIGSHVKSSILALGLKPIKNQPQIGGVELAQEITGYTRSSIYTMVSRGKIPHFKRDGRLLFNADKLRQWLTEGENETGVDYEEQFANRLKKQKG